VVQREERRNGAHIRLAIDHPPGNVLTREVMRQLRRHFDDLRRPARARLVTIEGAGDHFSYGASVDEHRPELVDAMLPEFHDLIRAVLALPAPTAAVVRGRCLGGGFELALACDLIFASSTAMLGVPEIALGAFPPAAAVLLPARIGASRAASAVLTGQVSPVDTWSAAGLVELTAPPAELGIAVDRWFDAHLAHRSASALGLAALASRAAVRWQVDALLPQLERLYLETLMRTGDAVEGITAFLEKRQPVWSPA
jgi:cyclohexa-1,5-dienecarbonyl-CoA hydratase